MMESAFSYAYVLFLAGPKKKGAMMYMTDGQILVLSFFLVQMSIGLSFASFSYGFTGAPQALLQSCLTFGAFSFIIEGLNKKQAALAHSISSRNKCDYHSKPCPLALPLSVPLPDELKGAFSFFCKSLRKPKSANFPAAAPWLNQEQIHNV